MIKIGMFQMNSAYELETNKAWILDQLASHDLSGIQFLFFPENTLSLKINDKDNLMVIGLDDPFFEELKSICIQNNLEIQMSTAIKDKDGQIYNSSFWITSEGIKDLYHKIHLFKVSLKNKTIDENLFFKTGSKPTIHNSKLGFNFGSSICYDLRFANLYQYYAEQNVDVITVPSAFIQRTGKDHWHILLRARAIETQAYIIAPAQSGEHICPKTKNVRRTYGHSLVIDPWGNILLDASEDIGLFTCYIDKSFLNKTKQILPMNRTFKG